MDSVLAQGYLDYEKANDLNKRQLEMKFEQTLREKDARQSFKSKMQEER